MNVLVTGGAGYIGSVVVEECIAGGHAAVVVDNLEKGHIESVHRDAKFIEGDIADPNLMRQAFHDNSIDAVIHMAAYSLVGESVEQPAKYYQNNVVKSLAMLEAMVASGVKNIVFSSTAAVYGEPEKQPIEETDRLQPTNPYGQTKLAFEEALKWYERAYGLRYVSLRYFNAAGATEWCGELHNPETHLIPIVLQVASDERESVAIYGDDYDTRDGTCVRDYIHVRDLAAAHVLALNGDKGTSSIYNLGCGGSGYTVREVIDVARKITGHPIPVTIADRRPGDPAVLIAGSDRIKAELGWKPEFQELELIVGSAWKWLQARPDISATKGGS
jgi:UDP-glucose 4-epimerase